MAQEENEELAKLYEAERLHWAVQESNFDRVKELLAAKEDINRFDEMGWTSLHHAARAGNVEMMRLLLENGANPNAHDESQIGDTPLGDVAGRCSLEVAKLLVEFGADPRIEGWMRFCALDRAEERKKSEGVAVYKLLTEVAAKLAKAGENKRLVRK